MTAALFDMFDRRFIAAGEVYVLVCVTFDRRLV